MRKYKARIADKILEKRLLGKGAVLIEGAKWCGKRTTKSDNGRNQSRETFEGKNSAADR